MSAQPATCGECRILHKDGAWHIIPCLLHAQAEATAEERDAAVRILRSLTPGGSEFQTSLECAAYVKQRERETRRILVRHKEQRNALLEAAQLAESTLGGAEHCTKCDTCAGFAVTASFLLCTIDVQAVIFPAVTDDTAALL